MPMYSKEGRASANRYTLFKEIIVAGEARAKQREQQRMRSAAVLRRHKRVAQMQMATG